MQQFLIDETRGYGLPARVSIDGHSLIVLDEFSDPNAFASAPCSLSSGVLIGHADPECKPIITAFDSEPKKELTINENEKYKITGQILVMQPELLIDCGHVILRMENLSVENLQHGMFIQLELEKLILRSL